MRSRRPVAMHARDARRDTRLPRGARRSPGITALAPSRTCVRGRRRPRAELFGSRRGGAPRPRTARFPGRTGRSGCASTDPLPAAAQAPLPVLVYFHGGGWVIGSLDTHDGVCRALCARTPCVVVSVDYRLAPEHRFPAAVDDAWAATAWVCERGRAAVIEPAQSPSAATRPAATSPPSSRCGPATTGWRSPPAPRLPGRATSTSTRRPTRRTPPATG